MSRITINPTEDLLAAVFGAYPYATVDWQTWTDKVASHLLLTDPRSEFMRALESMRLHLEVNNVVPKQRVSQFLSCFPHLNSERAVYCGHTVTVFHIESIIKSDWFHGFMSKDEAGNVLRDQPDGTFLVR
jgi:hypothetical protein